MKVMVIPERDQKARQHKKYGYAYVKLAKKPLYDKREHIIKNIGVVRNKNQVCSQSPHAG